eukprot:6187357-Pleurochrysis_carterae.AAC.1
MAGGPSHTACGHVRLRGRCPPRQVIAMERGGLFVYSPVAPTKECLALLKPIVEQHGPARRTARTRNTRTLLQHVTLNALRTRCAVSLRWRAR